jgi:hypothetical protein
MKLWKENFYMTVCKSFRGITLTKKIAYRKKEVIDLDGFDKMAATYYDVPRDELFTFLDEGSPVWENRYNGIIFKFKLRAGGPLSGPTPSWECSKKRHVFFRHKGTDVQYEYLGIALGERRVFIGPDEWVEYDIK